MVGVLPMKRIVLNAVFATLAVAVGCIIGWAFSLGAGAGLGGVYILQSYSHYIRSVLIFQFFSDLLGLKRVVGEVNKTLSMKTEIKLTRIQQKSSEKQCTST